MEEQYKTTDTALATFLITSGLHLSRIDYSQPRFEFAFIDSTQAQRLATDYVAGQALTEPIAFNRINRKLLRILSKRCQLEED